MILIGLSSKYVNKFYPPYLSHNHCPFYQSFTIISKICEPQSTHCLIDGHYSYFIGEGDGTSLQYSCLGIPGRGEPGGLPSMGLHRIGHD